MGFFDRFSVLRNPRNAGPMNLTSGGARLIKDFEGLELTAYPDPGTGADPWTVGYGHTGPEVRKGVTVTQAEADALFDKDVQKFVNSVRDCTAKAKTTQCQFNALVAFTYNVGPANLTKSTLLRKHLAGDYVGAAEEFLKWNKAAGKVMAGLTRRRQSERDLYLGKGPYV